MSDENKIRDAADAVKGLVDAVPIYEDALQPAAKEVGTALQTVAKTIHVALAPLSMMVWGYDRLRDYLERALSEKLKDVPPERIVTPDPSVAGPAVEALRFAAHHPDLREMYANLLARAMDAETTRLAHPAYVEILKQLSPDEAKLVARFAKENAVSLIHINAVTAAGREHRYRNLSLAGAEAGCANPDMTPTYLDNLTRLGIIRIPYNQKLSGIRASEYDRLLALPACQSIIDSLTKETGKSPHVEMGMAIITILGTQFALACLSVEDLSAYKI